jgi:GNAT superfamily N-acetyltransferase
LNFSVSEEVGDALALMEQALRGGEPLAAEYPLVFSEGASGRFIIAEESGQVGSTCAILERELLMPGGRLRIGLIGAVSTDEAQRGRGLASAVLERAEAELSSRGCAFSILWADDASFYHKRGYRQIGAETDYALPVDLLPALPSVDGVRKATVQDFDELHRQYTAHECRVDRSLEDSRVLFATPGMSVLVHESNGMVDGYACYERGQDLKNVIHEWAGAPEGVLACARVWLEALAKQGRHDALYLMAPAPAGPLGTLLTELGAPSAQGVLGMAKLLDAEAMLDELCLCASRPLVFQTLREDSWRVIGPGGTVDLDREQMLPLIFAPAGDRSEIERVQNILGIELSSLPRTPFLWGLDSI